jgi:CubicO group peptidase (beta-lactamase class C family)
VSHGAEILAEHYFRDRCASDRTNVHSVTKSVISALAGIAVDEGALAVDTPLVELVPAFVPDDERKRRITVRHLLTMTSGLQADGGYDIDEIADRGDSWFAGPLQAPLRSDPGTSFLYNNGAAHVLAIVLEGAVGGSLTNFARRRLFGPLGVEDFRWPADPDGHPLGYGHLEVRPCDLLSIGRLYLNRGVHEGARLVSEEWVALTTSAANAGGPPEGAPYGYLWWVTELGGRPAFLAGGFGGQYVVVIPDLEVVVVTVADVDVWTPTSASPLRLVGTTILPALG